MSADQDLREQFSSLRREDAGRTPSFHRVLQKLKRTHSIDARLRALIACLAIAATALPVFWNFHHRAATAPAIAAPWLADWRAPTDFLLNTPGRELLRAVPQIGEPSSDVLRLFPGLNDTTPARRIGKEPHS